MPVAHTVGQQTRQRLCQECQDIIDNEDAGQTGETERESYQIETAQAQSVDQEMQQCADSHQLPPISCPYVHTPYASNF